MKRLFSLFIALAFFQTTTAFAYNTSDLGQMIRDYKVDIRVMNVGTDVALENLTQKIVDSKITKKEFMDYVKTNLTEEEFKNFVAIVDYGRDELRTMGELNPLDFELILGEAITASSAETGANYAGCGVSVGLGVAAVLGGVILALLALDSNGNFGDDGVIFNNTNNSNRTRNLTIAAGITGAVGVALAAGASAGC